jgi:hypothetical protein
MREAVIELETSDIGIEMGVIVSRDEEAPNYDDVKDLPGFYTRISQSEKRTVYLSMTDKMTNAMMVVTQKEIDGSVSGFDPLSAVPELMHPNTKYYAYIYYGQGGLSSSSTTSKVEFTTTNYPASFPTANEQGKNGAIWSDFCAHKNNSVVIEYKADEKFFIPVRIYFKDPLIAIGTRKDIRISFHRVVQGGTADYEKFFKNFKIGHTYEFYGMPDAPDIAFEGAGDGESQIWDMMIAPADTYNHLSSSLNTETGAINKFFFIEKDDFKTKLVSE